MPRITIEIANEENTALQTASKKLGLSVEEFVRFAVLDKFDAFEDERLAEKAYQIIERIQEGKETTLDWEDLKKKL